MDSNRTSITKGSKTKDFSIICAGSLMNKDYTQNEENFIMLGGSPAKVLTSGLKRIFSTEIEKDIIYFSTTTQKPIIIISLLNSVMILKIYIIGLNT